MAKRRRPKRSAAKKIKFSFSDIPLYLLVLLLLSGVLLSFLDYYGVLTYTQITQFLGLSDKAVVAIDDAKLSVHSIDVGQGDSTLIVAGSTTVLIDAGEADEARSVIEYLNKYGIKRIDYVIATHPHSDHIGGIPDVMYAVPVGKIIMPRLPDELVPVTSSYNNLLRAISKNGLRATRAVPGDVYPLGADAYLEIIAPIREDYEEINNYSVVCRITCGEVSFLFMGDAEKAVENDIIESGADISADFLKVGHHGSTTSTRQPLLDAVRPEYAVIYCGSDNTYNHPAEKTLFRLRDNGIKIYRTDSQGNIIFKTDGISISAEVEHAGD